jgi:hypothetical protein
MAMINDDDDRWALVRFYSVVFIGVFEALGTEVKYE